MAEQRVTDEQLTEWATRLSEGILPPGIRLPDLIADLRASRARVAELLAERNEYRELWLAAGGREMAVEGT